MAELLILFSLCALQENRVTGDGSIAEQWVYTFQATSQIESASQNIDYVQ